MIYGCLAGGINGGKELGKQEGSKSFLVSQFDSFDSRFGRMRGWMLGYIYGCLAEGIN